MNVDGRRPEDERILAILEEARSAPLPTGERWDVQRDPGRGEERRREQIRSIAQGIQQVPALLVRQRSVRRRVALAVGTLVAAAAGMLLFAAPLGERPQLATAGALAPLAKTSEARPRGLLLKQVTGKVIATHPDGADFVLGQGMALREGDQISTTAEAYASLELETGIRVDLASATTLESVYGNGLVLRVGRVDVNVPKVPGVTPRLVVNTPNSQVVVRGTIFSVEVDGSGSSVQTAVGVTRGSVSVFHAGQERLIDAGKLWSSEAPSETATLFAEEVETGKDSTGAATENAEPVERTPARPAARRKSVPRATEGSGPGPGPTPTSNLSQQNRVFERGLRARDQGDDRRAAYWFDQLLRRYPNSPLAESAERERSAARARMNGD